LFPLTDRHPIEKNRIIAKDQIAASHMVFAGILW